jgi:hypothetical protein
MDYEFGEKVKILIKSQHLQKKSVYNHLDITQSGFDYKLKKGTFTAEELGVMAKLFNINVGYFYDDDQASVSTAKSDDVKVYFQRFFEDQMKAKDRQIENLQEVLKFAMMGKLQVSVFPHVTSFGSPLKKMSSFFLPDLANVYANSVVE